MAQAMIVTPSCTLVQRSVDGALVWEVSGGEDGAAERPPEPVWMRGEGAGRSPGHTWHPESTFWFMRPSCLWSFGDNVIEEEEVTGGVCLAGTEEQKPGAE